MFWPLLLTLSVHAYPRLDAMTTERRLDFVRTALKDQRECPPVTGTIDIGPKNAEGKSRVVHRCQGPKSLRYVEGTLSEDASGQLTYAPTTTVEPRPDERVSTETRVKFVKDTLQDLAGCDPLPGTVDLSPMSEGPEYFILTRVTFSCQKDQRMWFGEARLQITETYEPAWALIFYPDAILKEKLPRGFKLIPRAGA